MEARPQGHLLPHLPPELATQVTPVPEDIKLKVAPPGGRIRNQLDTIIYEKNLLCDLNTTFECEYYCTCTASTSLQGETYFSAQNRIQKKKIK
jgi:hypothetical protein